MGSDAVYTGFGTNMQELRWLVKLGMSNEQALRSATVLPAEMLGMEKSLGSVAPGYVADIVAVEGDPLADIEVTISKVRWVMKAGSVVVDKERTINRLGRGIGKIASSVSAQECRNYLAHTGYGST